MMSLSHSFLSLLTFLFSSLCSALVLWLKIYSSPCRPHHLHATCPFLDISHLCFRFSFFFCGQLLFFCLSGNLHLATSLCPSLLRCLSNPPPRSACLSPSVSPFHHADSGRSGAEGERGRHRDQRTPELPHRPGCRCQEPQGALIKNSPQLLVVSSSPPLLPSPAHSCEPHH